jgi:hypothetical protein
MVVGGTLFSAYSKIKAGREQQKMFERNAEFAEWQAVDALDRGKVNEKRQRQTTEGVIGSQRTSFAAQNVDVNKGSSLDVQADAAYLGELDALTIRNNAAKEAYGYRVGAEDLMLRGKYARREGEMGAINTILGGGSSLLLAKYGGGPYTISNAPGSAAPGRMR